MKAGEKTINLLACIALVLSTGFGVKALELWNERQLAVEQTQKLHGQLTQQIRFADEHSDYKTYQITLLEKQKKLKQQAEQNLSLNNRLQRLQKQAQAQSIQLSSMQLEGQAYAFATWSAAADSENKCCRQFLFPAALAAADRNATVAKLKSCACIATCRQKKC